MFPFYDYSNTQYQKFIVELLKSLEVRFYEAKKIIFSELEEGSEL